MRIKRLLAITLVMAGLLGASSAPTVAGGFDRTRPPEGWDNAQTVRHWVYYPRYRHVYHVDPYAYQYSPRGYYPYYGSRYWTSARVVRKRNHAHYYHWNARAPRYRYYPYWGGPRAWNHLEWHRQHHGRHHLWHW